MLEIVKTKVGVSIVIGQEYLFRNSAIKCRYVVIAYGTALHAMNEVVIYQGVDGMDRGKWFTCPPYDFALKFDFAPDRYAKGPTDEQVQGSLPDHQKSQADEERQR